jgi:hypothetical protein
MGLEDAIAKSLRLNQQSHSSDLLGPRASRPPAYDKFKHQELNLSYAGGRDARGPSKSLEWTNLSFKLKQL